MVRKSKFIPKSIPITGLTNDLVLYKKALTRVVKRVVKAVNSLQNKNRIAGEKYRFLSFFLC